MKIRINGVVNDSIVDGPGLRYTIFTQGCPHHCTGCHNPETHDANGGYDMEISKIMDEIKENPLLSGVTFSGGEPFLHIDELSFLANEIKKRNLHLIIYTGFTWEEIIKNSSMLKLAKLSDLIIDGKFVEQERSLNIKFRGSKNQRIIHTLKSLETGGIVTADI